MSLDSPPAEFHSPSGERGFTLSEIIVVVFLIAILVTVIVGSLRDWMERARMAECFVELRGIQAALWTDTDGGSRAVDPAAFWEKHYNGSKPGPYVLLVNPSPTAAARPAVGSFPEVAGGRSAFVVVARYEHWPQGRYVYIEADRPPILVTRPEDDPGYGEKIDWENGRRWGVGEAPAGVGAGVSWTGTQTTGTDDMAYRSGSGSSGPGSNGGASTGSTTGSGSGRTTTSSIGD